MLKIVPLGGLGEIGLNSMVIEQGDDRMLVDAGLMFASNEPGAGVIYPDFSYLYSQPDKLKGVFLTHAHEDHLGALSDLLKAVNVPVYGAPFTVALARLKLEEANVEADLREVGPGERIPLSDTMSLEPVRMAHSIPDAAGCFVHTPEGTVLHTGDFKIDRTPTDGRTVDEERLARAGDEGLRLLLSDSTNAERDDETGSEAIVARAFERLFETYKERRLIFSMFASNMARIRHTLELCARTGRKVALLGRSLQRNVDLAGPLGYLEDAKGVVVSPEEAARLPKREVVLISTGSQAEPRSGLTSLIEAERELWLEPGDVVVLSARAIPGNERAVSDLINRLLARGAEVLHAGNAPDLHVSGHASKPQQKRVLELTRPRAFVPIHGELRHLTAHLATGRQQGLGDSSLVLARDGDVVQLTDQGAFKSGTVAHGRRIQDRFTAGELSVETLAERERLSVTGVVVVVVTIDRDRNKVIWGPMVEGRGLTSLEAATLPRCAEECRAHLEALSPPLLADDALVKEELIRGVRKIFKTFTAKRPTVVPVVVKV